MWSQNDQNVKWMRVIGLIGADFLRISPLFSQDIVGKEWINEDIMNEFDDFDIYMQRYIKKSQFSWKKELKKYNHDIFLLFHRDFDSFNGSIFYFGKIDLKKKLIYYYKIELRSSEKKIINKLIYDIGNKSKTAADWGSDFFEKHTEAFDYFTKIGDFLTELEREKEHKYVNIIYSENWYNKPVFFVNIIAKYKIFFEKFLKREYFFQIGVLKNLIDSFKNEIIADNLRYSIESAISAIMSRNMSHNIGSHVLTDLVSKTDLISSEHLNNFYRYLQNRMDFIAQITTDFPEWSYPAYFNKELMRIFYESYILIDRIGVSEGLGAYKWPKDWRKGDMRGKIIVRTCTTKWEKGSEIENAFDWGVNEYHMGNLINDIQLAIPGGIVGYHAFYIIIENIIRNSAKHDYDARMKESLKLDNCINDEIIFIKYKNRNKCSFWLVRKNGPCEIIKLNDTNKKETIEKIKSARALIIESSCFVVKKKENPDNPDKDEYEFIREKDNDLFEIKLIDVNLSSLIIKDTARLFIACKANTNGREFNFKNCLVVNKDYWTKKKTHYQLLTKEELKQLKEKYKIAESTGKNTAEHSPWKESYDNIINFLQKGPLRINIRVDDIVDKDYVWVTIWDNMRHKPSHKFDKKKDERHEVSGEISEEAVKKRVLRIPDGADQKDYKTVNLFGYMNDRLRQSFIKETGELKREDWGIAELKICAGFLQNRKIEEIGGSSKKIIQYGDNCFKLKPKFIIDEADNPNVGYPRMLIKALPVNKTGQLFNEDKGGKLGKGDFYFLGFRFWMKKPKTVLLHGIECKKEKGKNAG